MQNKLTAKERRSQIIDLLHKKDRFSIKEMVKMYGISEVSIRKDLAILEEQKFLIRVKGGAVLVKQDNYTDIPISNKTQRKIREKQLIGEKAASLIKNGETIIIDSGTTSLQVANNLSEFDNLTIITNGINIASRLAEYDKFNVIVLGGYLRNESLSTIGIQAESTMKSHFCDKLFLGVDSCNFTRGLSTPNAEEARLNQTMIEAADEVIAIMDSSKFEKKSFSFIAPLSAINTIVTDSGISQESRDNIERQGIKLYVVDINQKENNFNI
ncbi:MAG: DeoR/GlpR family DNA-binding transcription regulator [Bacteroidales bacterium]|jgi:DeoR/GlpR family transcriptional regulator of sugar metabolism|nr:DeoR/GlpR family DNA-binding transcription regulator [Bacteroidales bacterium]